MDTFNRVVPKNAPEEVDETMDVARRSFFIFWRAKSWIL
jgi:hypothetical protein